MTNEDSRIIDGWMAAAEDRWQDSQNDEDDASLCPDCGDPMPANSLTRVCQNCAEDAHDRELLYEALDNERQDMAIEASAEDNDELAAGVFVAHDRVSKTTEDEDERNSILNTLYQYNYRYQNPQWELREVKPVALTDEERAELKAQCRPHYKLPEGAIPGQLSNRNSAYQNKMAHDPKLHMPKIEDRGAIFDED